MLDQRNAVETAIKNSWDSLWYPAPENCAEDFLHPSLTKPERDRTIRRLMEIDQVGGARIMVLLDKISSYEEQANKIKDALNRLEGIAPQLDQKREHMKSLNAQIDNANRQIGSLKNEVASLDSQLQTKNTGIAKLGAQLDQAQPSMRKATKADFVAVAIDEIVKQAVPSQISDIAAKMTETHKLMSHKSDLVDRIDIDENCNVNLLNSSGFDVRDLDLSAGEKQIFTQALISAVVHVSGRAFPMIIDTPLGRLDSQHRMGVIKHLSQIGSQVILLSTNTEIIGDYYKAIQPYLLKEYVIEQEQVGGFGISNPRVGYFEEGKSS
jgi:DNA sulfur modification protein DndD